MEQYKDNYGDWAGNPGGKKPDFTRCAVEVYPNERGAIPHQCSNKAKFDPNEDGKPTTCKIHSKQAVAERKKAAKDKYAEYLQKNRPQWHGPAFMKALIAIANGHNDPRGLAEETIDSSGVEWRT